MIKRRKHSSALEPSFTNFVAAAFSFDSESPAVLAAHQPDFERVDRDDRELLIVLLASAAFCTGDLSSSSSSTVSKTSTGCLAVREVGAAALELSGTLPRAAIGGFEVGGSLTEEVEAIGGALRDEVEPFSGVLVEVEVVILREESSVASSSSVMFFGLLLLNEGGGGFDLAVTRLVGFCGVVGGIILKVLGVRVYSLKWSFLCNSTR